jgi:hypothetical protein
VGELIDRATIELARGNEFVARLQQAVEGHHLRGVAGRSGKSRGAAFERGDAFLEHGRRRIADAGVDIAECRQPEQRGCVVDAFENVGGGLVDRGGTGAGGWVGLRASMHRKRGKTRDAFGHAPFLWAGPRR